MSAPGNLEEDRRLVEAAKAGDAAAFEAIYDANASFVLRVALRLGLEGADAHDVVQESFLYLVRKLPTLVLTARIGTLLYTVAKHAALKKKKSPPSFPSKTTVTSPPPPRNVTPPSGSTPGSASRFFPPPNGRWWSYGISRNFPSTRSRRRSKCLRAR